MDANGERSLKILYQFQDIVREYGRGKPVELEADVVIVGSGAGGAPLAYELAGEGYSVIVLEEGGYHTTSDFRFQWAWAASHIYRDGGVNITLGTPVMLAPVGRTVGGTTTINQGNAMRVPPSLIERWHSDFGLYDIDYEELALYYCAVEEFLFVQKVDPEVAGNNARKFIEGARKIGLNADYLTRNAKDCEGYGHCIAGCPSGAKQSMVVSYIPEAVKRDADVYADCSIEEILVENGRAAGFAGYFIDHGTSEVGPQVKVHGKVAVLAAGALGTPLLLFRNRLCNSSGQVGKNYFVHPAMITVPVWDELIEPAKGISESAMVKDFEDYGFLLETAAMPPDVLSMPVVGLSSSRGSDIMRNFAKSGCFVSMIRDSRGGRLIPLDRKANNFIVLYQLSKEDFQKTKTSTVMQVEIALAAGAKRVHTPIIGHEVIESSKDLERLRNVKLRKTQIVFMTGWHPQGTCRMGTSPDISVVKPTLESWDVPDLFIVDASVFPSAVGAHPQITIMAFSMRSAGFIDERLAEKGVRPPKASKKKLPEVCAEEKD